MKWTLFLVLSFSLVAQKSPIEDYNPPSTLVVPGHEVFRSKFPFIDVHNHQWDMPKKDLKLLALQMDSLNMAVMVNLSGRGFNRVMKADSSFEFKMGDQDNLKKGLENIKSNINGRMIMFTNIDFAGIGTKGWTEKAVKELEEDVKAGANGLKIYKSLGMDIVDDQKKRVHVDDERLDPIWKKCAELKIPVLIHTADPFQFWQPNDKKNERWYELQEIPGRYRDPAKNETWEELITEQHHLFRKHSKTTFINAHLGWMGNDLDKLGKLFDECPNVYTEIGAVLAELGRQPRNAKKWFIKYQDRVMFGKDSWAPSEYYTYFRVLETDDEYFTYYRRRHAFWKMYGLDLPDDILKKLYYKNALRIIPGIDKSKFPD